VNIALLWRNKKADIVQIDEGSPENLDQNLDSLFQDIARMAQRINAYSVNLATDVTGVLPLANVVGGPAGQLLTGNGSGVPASYQATAASGMPVVGGTAAAGMRVMWAQYAGAGSATMGVAGCSVPTMTGGSGVLDNDGNWNRPLSAVGSTCRLSWFGFVTRMNQLPKMIARIRTPADIVSNAGFRLSIGMNEAVTGVDADLPSLTTQRGIYVRYSVPAADTQWCVQTVDSAGRTLSANITPIAASTIYVITITVNSLSSITVDINGVSVNVTANIIAGVNLAPELLARAGAGVTTSFDIESVYLQTL